MQKRDDEILKLLHCMLQKECKNYRYSYFFGSRVNGTAKPDSDYDVVILLNKMDRETKFDIYGLLSDIDYKFDVFIDSKILTEDEFKINPFFYDEVTHKGVCYGDR
ncbi:MAG: nucleotidyltransferase domain-containing protein [Candidatus Cloacimonetes bacterium]|nr:nucleotidyltransferase domain-containing protein [Candidatus Cloacimonadota bacterium]